MFTMLDYHAKFIHNVMEETGQVMLYKHTASNDKIPLGIKKNFSIHADGNLHIPINAGFEDTVAEQFFPIDLFFYKKGTPYYIFANGYAEKIFVNGENDICIKMENVDVFKVEKKRKNIFQNLFTSLNNF
jgi:hypothetical protein